MSVYSMTGFAHATQGAGTGPDDTAARGAGTGVTVEVRSVNSRFLDLSFRLPDELRGLEPALRELVGAALKRGKVEVRVAPQREADGAWPQPQPDQLMRLARLESTVTGWLPNARPLSVNEALAWCRRLARRRSGGLRRRRRGVSRTCAGHRFGRATCDVRPIARRRPRSFCRWPRRIS